MDIRVCPHCQVVRFPGERPSICCDKGKIKLEPLPPVTDLLRTLLSRTTAESRHFLKHIRSYTACF
eukprot:94683-Hanusia_phi.AAC.1